jgi:hypothetical protein
MQHSWIAVLAGLPLIIGAGVPQTRPDFGPMPQVQPAGVVEVNFLDRLLQDGKPRRHRSTNQRRTPRPTASQPSVSQPPVAAVVPVPTPKPVAQAEAAPETSQQTNPATAAPPASLPPAPEVQGQASGNAASANQPPPPVVEQPGTASEPAYQAEVPKPLPKPEEPPLPSAGGKDAATSGDAKPDEAKPNETRPQEAKPADAKPDQAKPDAAGPEATKPEGKQQEEQKSETPPPPPPPPLVKEDPEELKACLADITALGAKFAPTDPIDEGNGCGIEKPIDVSEVLPGVSLGGATMRCQTAQALGHWLKDTVQPALNIAMPGRRITGLVPGSTYACRLRNSAATGKMSEHARGSAFDVAAFKLDNGEKMMMKPRDEDATMEGAFQRTATAGACLHFTTVLSPGSDAAHEDHLHLDVLERKGGYRYCR